MLAQIKTVVGALRAIAMLEWLLPALSQPGIKEAVHRDSLPDGFVAESYAIETALRRAR